MSGNVKETRLVKQFICENRKVLETHLNINDIANLLDTETYIELFEYDCTTDENRAVVVCKFLQSLEDSVVATKHKDFFNVLKNHEDIGSILHKQIAMHSPEEEFSNDLDISMDCENSEESSFNQKEALAIPRKNSPAVSSPKIIEPMELEVESSEEDEKRLQKHQQVAKLVGEDASIDLQKSDSKLPAQKPVELRNYQQELVISAVNGKNVIISAPPGSGKTIVACHIIERYLERSSVKNTPVLMFTPGGALATQQCDRLKQQLPKECKVELMSGSAGCSTFAETLKVDVIVLTPQILLNELNKEDEIETVKIDDFGLFIFDECHRCTKGHPYNAVMKKYFASKVEAKETIHMPQIVGLSATLGIGQASDLKTAVKVVKSLCANLDAVDGIVSVKQHIKELAKHTPTPDETMITLPSRTEGEFVSRMVSLMDEVKQMLEENIVGNCACPSLNAEDLNKQVLKQWCVSYRDVIARQSSDSDKDHSRVAHTCLDYIEQCIETLDFYTKCQPHDAVVCLETWLDKQKLTAFKKYLPQERKVYEKTETMLKCLSQAKSSPNPNLLLIEDIIINKFESDPNSKGMIMVEMRKYTHAFKRWVANNNELKSLNAEVFTGTGSSTGEDAALTHQQQKQVMENFREGKHKLLICTPDSTGEGIDVKDCNLVIIYDIMTNEVTSKQIKGRARKDGGDVFQLCSPRVARRDHLNKHKTILMEKARAHVEKEISDNLEQFQNDLNRLQNDEYRLERLKKSKATPKKCEDEYLLQCKKCSVEVCSSRDVRAIELKHHICIDPNFEKRYTTQLSAKKKKFDDMDIKDKVVCGGCGKDWGVECLWKGVVTTALLQIKNFKILRKGSSSGKCLTPKKWKDVPFKVSEPTVEEMTTI